VKSAFFLALLLAARLCAEDARVTALVVQGDEADRQHRTGEALADFQKAQAIVPNDPGVLLRISKQYCDLANEAKTPETAQPLAETALGFARRAVALDGRNAKAHLNLAVCYAKLTDFAGSKTKVEYSKLIRDETQQSLALDPADAYAWHVMGRWNAGVANVGMVMKALAKLVYDGLPAASNEEAVRCFKKAIELAPARILHHAELAKVYQAMSKGDLAAQEWQNVLGLKADDGADENYHREARLAVEAQRPSRGFGSRALSALRNAR
jgi:tetratricopeptide (TPR) repeat protein